MNLKPAGGSLLALAAVLAGCGSSQSSSAVAPTVTVTVPGPAATTGTAPAPAVAPLPSRTVPTPPTVPAPRTRTGPAPAFATGGTPVGGALPAAEAKVRGLGFAPFATASFDPNQTLRVLLGARAGSAGGRAEQAFFFDGAKYLGTDAASTSGQIALAGHGDTDATLRYASYRPGDPDCCPTGAGRTVHFTLDGGRLVALDPIPPVASRR